MNFNSRYHMDGEWLVAVSCHHVPFTARVRLLLNTSADDILHSVEEAEDLIDWLIADRAREQE